MEEVEVNEVMVGWIEGRQDAKQETGEEENMD